MIVVHGIEAESGGGTREERRVLLSPNHLVSIINGMNNQTLLVSQSQSKEGSIMIAVEETQEQVALLLAYWRASDRRTYLDDGSVLLNIAVEWRDGKTHMIQETVS